MAGVIADLVSVRAAILAVAALTALSGLFVIARMYETLRPANTFNANGAPPAKASDAPKCV